MWFFNKAEDELMRSSIEWVRGYQEAADKADRRSEDLLRAARDIVDIYVPPERHALEVARLESTLEDGS